MTQGAESPTALVRRLLTLARTRRHRQTLVIAGEADWTAEQARAAVAALPELTPLWLTDRALAPAARPMRTATRLLGQDLDLLVYDAYGGFDPDGFGAATGGIRGGGLLILLTPPLADWPGLPDPQAERIALWPHSAASLTGRFIARLVSVLSQSPDVCLLEQSRCSEAFQNGHYPSGSPPPSWGRGWGRGGENTEGLVPVQPATPDQHAAIAAILRTARGRARRPLVITAHRGRGKSAALGLAAGRLLLESDRRILVCAPGRESVATLFGHAEAVLREAGVAPDALIGDAGRLRFLLPDRLAETLPPADLLLVDEAAGIPAHLLATLLAHYGRIVFASTVHGYEGTGRGFEIRFRATLERLTPDWRALTLETPIRWAPNDPLESLTFRALLLAAAPADGGEIADATLADCQCERLDRDQLAGDEATLTQLFGLLVLAHYQTRPLDLRLLLDGADVRILAVRYRGHIVATLLAAQEGGFTDQALLADIFAGRRRPRGHLLPQTLSAHAGLARAPAWRYLRVIRIAVHPAVARRGLGCLLLARLRLDARAEGLDLIGASFGATPELLRFWVSCGLRALHLGTSRNAASGEQAAVVLEPISAGGEGFVRQAGARFAAALPVMLAGPLRGLDPAVAVELLRALPAGAAGAIWQGGSAGGRQELDAFVAGHRTFDASLPLLSELLGCRLGPALGWGEIGLDDAALLVAAVRQFRPMAELVRLCGAQGRDDVLVRLRLAAGRLSDPIRPDTCARTPGPAPGSPD
mgnify:CR=1 FL=1